MLKKLDYWDEYLRERSEEWSDDLLKKEKRLHLIFNWIIPKIEYRLANNVWEIRNRIVQKSIILNIVSFLDCPESWGARLACSAWWLMLNDLLPDWGEYDHSNDRITRQSIMTLLIWLNCFYSIPVIYTVISDIISSWHIDLLRWDLAHSISDIYSWILWAKFIYKIEWDNPRWRKRKKIDELLKEKLMKIIEWLFDDAKVTNFQIH